jgi:hypothetical protein
VAKFVQVRTVKGDTLFINPEGVLGIGAVTDDKGMIVVGETGVLLMTGTMLTVKGSPHELQIDLSE